MEILNFDKFLFRCSALGNIATGMTAGITAKGLLELEHLEEKSKAGTITEKQKITLGELIKKRDAKPTLSKGVMTHLKNVHKGAITGRDKEITSKYFDKGNQVEEAGITLYSKHTNKFLVKNKKHFENDFFKGTPDIISDRIVDIKNSYELDTFPAYEDEIPTFDYYLQLQGYMNLTGLRKSELVYCLNDTPFNLIDDELRRLDWRENVLTAGGDVREDSIERVVKLVKNHIFTEKALRDYCEYSEFMKIEWFTDFIELPEWYRIKIFEVDYDEELIDQLKNQVVLCREYLNKLSDNLRKKTIVQIGIPT